jgi:hypothetical protein
MKTRAAVAFEAKKSRHPALHARVPTVQKLAFRKDQPLHGYSRDAG